MSDLDATAIQLDEVSILANRGPQSPIQSLGGVSVVGRDEIARYNAGDLEDVLATIPGVSTTSDRDDPGVSISVRGLRDSGRVNVMIDGARQNFGVQGHLDSNLVYVDPALLGGIDVIRGPVANAYGSGAIGGVVAMRTLELEDLLTPSERYAARLGTVYGTNGPAWLGKLEAGVRLTEDADVYGAFVYRDEDDDRDGDGNDVDNTGFDVRSVS
ncbi:TonB-dependent receptor plug domain-containing protein [Aurantimonas manganoxydans]|uniref:TonB-dependent receptor plug domain-containing protein n=1 Tax=Aurantimonas manganoxydans TaxID=651183 RepID=UPI00137591C1|nr:TonB-dependent receptor plug domain-containing protein [Aurantimonas manganoxydans]